MDLETAIQNLKIWYDNRPHTKHEEENFLPKIKNTKSMVNDLNEFFHDWNMLLDNNILYLISPDNVILLEITSYNKFVPVGKIRGRVVDINTLPINSNVNITLEENSKNVEKNKFKKQIKHVLSLYYIKGDIDKYIEMLYDFLIQISSHKVLCFRAPCPPIFDEQEFLNSVIILMAALNPYTKSHCDNQELVERIFDDDFEAILDLKVDIDEFEMAKLAYEKNV